MEEDMNGTTSLPLLSYLAFKNHGAFILDRLEVFHNDISPKQVKKGLMKGMSEFSSVRASASLNEYPNTFARRLRKTILTKLFGGKWQIWPLI
jgi:hypothetical protein